MSALETATLIRSNCNTTSPNYNSDSSLVTSTLCTKESDITRISSLQLWTWIIYCFIFVGYGSQLSAPGPILNALQTQVHTDLSSISMIFLARGCGFMLGAIVGGYIIDKYNKTHQMISISMILVSICLAYIPFIKSIYTLTIVFGLSGIFYGDLDTSINVSILMLFDTNDDRDSPVGPYMQFLHFAWAVGSFLSPLLVELSFHITQYYALAFYVLAALFISLAIIICFIPSPVRIASNKHTIDSSQPHHMSVERITCILFCFGLFLGIYVGAEIGYGGYIETYSVHYVNTTSSIGRFVTSVYWGGLAFGRLMATFIAKKITTIQMVIFNLTGCMISCVILWIGSRYLFVLYLSSFLYGFFMSSMFPCMFILAEETLTVSGRYASIIQFGASVGQLSLPTVEGIMMATYGMQSFHIITNVYTIILILLFGGILLLRPKNVAITQHQSHQRLLITKT
eukprot:51737_1